MDARSWGGFSDAPAKRTWRSAITPTHTTYSGWLLSYTHTLARVHGLSSVRACGLARHAANGPLRARGAVRRAALHASRGVTRDRGALDHRLSCADFLT